MRRRTVTGVIATTVVAGMVVATASITGCGGQTQKTASLVYVNWAEGIAYTHLAKKVLEEKMGYDVTISAVSVAPAYAAIAQGDKDAFMESWLPTLHKSYYEKYKDDIVDLGNVYEGTRSGLVVPAYMEIDSISQLNGIKDALDGTITGIDAGAGIMETTDKVIELYGLDYTLVQSSGAAMTSALKKAVNDSAPIVVTGWKPHWMFGSFDLKFLAQDSGKKVWEKGKIHIFGRKDLQQEKPELAAFLSNMYFTDAQLADLMRAVEKSPQDINQVVTTWMNDHEELIDSWIPASAKETAE